MSGPSYRIHLDEWDYGNEEVMVLFREDEDGKRYKAEISWVEYSPWKGAEEPTLKISSTRLQRRRPISGLLIQALQETGELRKAQVIETTDLRAHLEDMRKLVFKGDPS